VGVYKDRSKSESITFRLASGVVDNLKRKAKQDKVTVNTLVSQIIADYLDWSMTAVDAGWMVMPKLTVKKVFEMLSQDEILTLADATYEEKKEMVVFMKGINDEQSFLSMLRTRAQKSGFHLRELEKDGRTTLIIQHDMGRNYSLFCKSLYETLMHQYGVQVQLQTTEHTLTMLF
jgi:hypothetical protein